MNARLKSPAVFSFLFFQLLVSCRELSAMNPDPLFEPARQSRQEKIARGPLRISADETLSKENGKIIECRGRVSMKYELESGDALEAFSTFARYDEKQDLGELSGNPKAFWKRKDPSQPETALIAEKITFKIGRAELFANGRVSVLQSSSTLKAERVTFFNLENKVSAEGQRPQFTIRQPQQNIKITAEKIVAWTEKRQIQFNRKVQGTIEFVSQP